MEHEVVGKAKISFVSRASFLKQWRLPKDYKKSRGDSGEDSGFSVELEIGEVKVIFWSINNVPECYPSFIWERDEIEATSTYSYVASGRTIAYMQVRGHFATDVQKSCRNVMMLCGRILQEWQWTGVRIFKVVKYQKNLVILSGEGQPFAYTSKPDE